MKVEKYNIYTLFFEKQYFYFFYNDNLSHIRVSEGTFGKKVIVTYYTSPSLINSIEKKGEKIVDFKNISKDAKISFIKAVFEVKL